MLSPANCDACDYVGDHIIQADFTAGGNGVTWAYTGIVTLEQGCV